MFVKYSDFKYLGKTLDPSLDNRLPLRFYARVIKTKGVPFFRSAESVIVFRDFGVPYWQELETGKWTKGHQVETLCDSFEAKTGTELKSIPTIFKPSQCKD